MLIGLLAGCGGTGGPAGNSAGLEVDPATLAFPLAETATITGLTNFPAGTESEPNNRTISSAWKSKPMFMWIGRPFSLTSGAKNRTGNVQHQYTA